MVKSISLYRFRSRIRARDIREAKRALCVGSFGLPMIWWVASIAYSFLLCQSKFRADQRRPNDLKDYEVLKKGILVNFSFHCIGLDGLSRF